MDINANKEPGGFFTWQAHVQKTMEKYNKDFQEYDQRRLLLTYDMSNASYVLHTFHQPGGVSKEWRFVYFQAVTDYLDRIMAALKVQKNDPDKPDYDERLRLQGVYWRWGASQPRRSKIPETYGWYFVSGVGTVMRLPDPKETRELFFDVVKYYYFVSKFFYARINLTRGAEGFDVDLKTWAQIKKAMEERIDAYIAESGTNETADAS